jgi:hypothetical protein
MVMVVLKNLGLECGMSSWRDVQVGYVVLHFRPQQQQQLVCWNPDNDQLNPLQPLLLL